MLVFTRTMLMLILLVRASVMFMRLTIHASSAAVEAVTLEGFIYANAVFVGC